MKYAFMTFSCPDWTLDEVLAAAQRYGYDGVELRIWRRRSQDTAAPRSPLHRLCSAPGGAAVRCGVTASCSSIPLLPRFDPQMSSMPLLLEAEQMYPPVR